MFTAETRQLAAHCRSDLSAFLTKICSEEVMPFNVMQKFQCMLSFCDLIREGSSLTNMAS